MALYRFNRIAIKGDAGSLLSLCVRMQSKMSLTDIDFSVPHVLHLPRRRASFWGRCSLEHGNSFSSDNNAYCWLTPLYSERARQNPSAKRWNFIIDIDKIYWFFVFWISLIIRFSSNCKVRFHFVYEYFIILDHWKKNSG